MRRLIFLSLILTLMVSCGKADLFYGSSNIRVNVTSSETKGTVTTTDGLKSSGAFSMVAYLSDKYVRRVNVNDPDSPLSKEDGTAVGKGEEPFLFGEENGLYFSGEGNVTLNGGNWSIAPDGSGKEYMWVADVDTYFWAWHPVTVPGRLINSPTPADRESYPTRDPNDPDSPRSPYTGELTFSYVTPAVTGTNDADNAKDLLFAYSKKKFENKKNLTDSDKTVNITFHHALSQVRFCVSTDDGTFDKGLKIKSISISNLKTSGNGSFMDSGNAENNRYAYNPADGSYDQFVWTGQSGSATFGQEYNADFSGSSVSGWTKGSYPYANGTPNDTSDDIVCNLYTCENVFFMIPQTVTPANKMTVVFDYNGVEMVRTADIADTSGTEWLGDHYYTYKIKATTLGRDIDFSARLVGWTNRKEEIFI